MESKHQRQFFVATKKVFLSLQIYFTNPLLQNIIEEERVWASNYLITKKKNVLNCQYCYFINRPYNRISDMNSFSEYLSPKEENILAVEISCHYESDIWKSSDEEIFSMCIQEIEKDNFLKKADVTNYKVIKVPSVYPIYRKDYEIHLKETEEYFAKIKNFLDFSTPNGLILYEK